MAHVEKYDDLIIGSGIAGKFTAWTRDSRRRMVIVERGLLGGACPNDQVCVHDAVIIEADVRELWTARAIAHRPDVFCGRFQALISLDVAALVELNAGLIQTDSVAVCLHPAPGQGDYLGGPDQVLAWQAGDFAARGIRANAISPGPIETPIFDGQFSTKEAANALREQFKANIPLRRLRLPEEIASAALFLASKESSYITGIDLPVDGGLVSV